MLIILDIALLILLVKLLVEFEKPLLPAIIFTVYRLIFSGLFGDSLLAVLMVGGLSFGFSFVWFELLDRVDTASVGWWLIVAAGVTGWLLLNLYI